jgi:hypothetical protein
VAVGVRVGGKGHVVLVLQPHQAGHRPRAAAIHADAAVVIDRHEAELRVDAAVDDFDRQAVLAGDRLPVVDRRPAERIDPEF